MERNGKTISFAAGLLALSFFVPHTVMAEQGLRPSTYADLPGVKPLDPIAEGGRVRCEQVLIDRAHGNIMPGRGPRYHTVNVCSRDGGPEFSSPRLPPSIYRQLRGFNY
jgi:hypothetical protein